MLYPILIVLAALIVGGLGYYAFSLSRKVRALEGKRKQDAVAMADELNQQRNHRNRSIQIIAQGIMTEQLSLTEGAIRIRVLMDGLNVDAAVQEEFNAFYQLSDATSHIPILEEWKKLKLKQRLAFDNERVQLERDHKEFVEDAAQRILGREF